MTNLKNKLTNQFLDLRRHEIIVLIRCKCDSYLLHTPTDYDRIKHCPLCGAKLSDGHIGKIINATDLDNGKFANVIPDDLSDKLLCNNKQKKPDGEQ